MQQPAGLPGRTGACRAPQERALSSQHLASSLALLTSDARPPGPQRKRLCSKPPSLPSLSRAATGSCDEAHLQKHTLSGGVLASGAVGHVTTNLAPQDNTV